MADITIRPAQILSTTANADPHARDKWEITSKGKGKIKQRQSQLLHGTSWVPRIPNLSHSDLEHGEQEGDPCPRYQEEMAANWVEYITLDSQQNVHRALNMFRTHQPVLLRGCPLVTGLVGSWSFQRLSSIFESAPKSGTIPVLCSDAKRHRFWDCDLSKNLPRCPDYYIREPETQILDMHPSEFVESALKWKERRIMLQATLLHQSTSRVNNISSLEGSLNSLSSPVSTALEQELRSGINWRWLTGLLASQRYGPLLRVGLEIGTQGGLLPAHYKTHDYILAQLVGRRRVLLLPPETAFNGGAHPYPVAHPYDRYSMIDLENPDSSKWPDASKLQGVCCVLRPGDVLYVPQYWFAHVHDLEKESVCLTFQLHSGNRPPAVDSLALRLSRVVEERCADVVGCSNVRHWLQLIARGKELNALDLGTVVGYERVVMCQGLRDEIDAVLGPGEWAKLLAAICKGRLLPTPWLNQNFREPLLLTDKPVILEDTRSEEEKRFPTLFRKKLEAEGWHVPVSQSTLPIPGYNNIPAH